MRVKSLFVLLAAVCLLGFAPKVAQAVEQQPTVDNFYFSNAYEYGSVEPVAYERATFYYTGKPVEPELRCNLYGCTIVRVTYENNTNPGTAVAVAEWDISDRYTGEAASGVARINFFIKKKALPDFEIFGYEGGAFDYTGAAIEPEVEPLGSWSGEMRLGHEYVVTYENNINPGTAKIIVSGKGLYGGCQILTFKIDKRKLTRSDFYFKNGTTYAYTGNAVRPKIEAGDYEEDGLWRKYLEGKDYRVTYKNNVKTGKAQAVIQGIGRYQGAVTLNFKIARATKLKLNYAYKGAKQISGKALNVAKGDIIKLKIGKKTYVKKAKTASKSLAFSFKVPKQVAGQKYSVTILSKDKKKVASKGAKVWYTNKLKLGQTKKQVKLNPKWGSPSYVNKSIYGETWVYEDYDSNGHWIGSSYLYFKNGKLVSWVL